MNALKLQLILEAQDRASKVLDRIEARTKGLGTATQKAAATSGAAWVTSSKQSSAAILLTASAAEKATEKAGKMSEAIARTGRASEHVEKAARHTRSLADQMERVGQKATLAGGAITAASALAIRASMEQEKARASAQNAFSGVNGLDGHWDAINKQATEMGIKYPGSTGDYLDAATGLKEMGVATEAIEKGALKGTAALKVMFNLSGKEAGGMMGGLMNAFGIKGDDAYAYADLIQRQKYATGLGIQDLAVASTYVGPKLKAYELQGLEEAKSAGIVMGVLKRAGVEASQIGTAYGGFLDRIALIDAKSRHLRGGVNVEAFGAVQGKGIQLDFFDEHGKMKGQANAVAQLAKLGALSQQDRKLVMTSFFGAEAERMTLVTPQKWNEVNEAMLNQEDIGTRLERVTGTLAAKWEAVGGSASNAADRLVDKMKPTLIPLLDKVNTLLDRIGKWADAHPRLAGLIGTTTLALGGLLTVGGGLIWTTSKLWTGLREGLVLFRLLPGAVGASTVALEANAAASGAAQLGIKGMASGLGLLAVKVGIVLVALKLLAETYEGIAKTFKTPEAMGKDLAGASEKARGIRPVLESHSPEGRAAFFNKLDMRNDVDSKAMRQALAYERAWKKTYQETDADLSKAAAAGEKARFEEERKQFGLGTEDLKHPFRKWFGFGGGPGGSPTSPVTYAPTYNIDGAKMTPEELKKMFQEHGQTFLGVLDQWRVSDARGAF